jgi:DNA polymerase III subunit epsilon
MTLTEIIKLTKVKNLKFKRIDFDENNIDGGIYRLYDESGKVIYVGKSGNLKKRLKQHLGHDTNTSYFVDEVVKADWLVEPDPVFQTLLESIFIAYHRPKYNSEVKNAKKKFGEEFDPTRQ